MAEGNTETTVEPDPLIKKKRSSRAGHRASATRIIGQVDPAITASNASKLKQLKLSLTEKASLLLKLDEEILSQLEED